MRVDPTRASGWKRRVLAALGTVLLAWSCGGSPLLGPDAAQGIDGTVLIGPMCPVASPDNPCPDQPYQATIQILDWGQKEITTVRSDADGHFRVGLEPGSYVVVPENGDPFPVASEKVVTVGDGVWSTVTINYDTGIR